MSIIQTKVALRREFLARRLNLSGRDLVRMSTLVQERLVETEEYKGARRLALYSSFRNEVLTDAIFLKALEAGKEVYFPRVVRHGPHLDFFKVERAVDLVPGSYDILEPPQGGLCAEPESFDCLVVPGVAFDVSGARIGYGKGYYDRALQRVTKPVVALAFEFQLTPSKIPVGPRDSLVKTLVTESRVLRF